MINVLLLLACALDPNGAFCRAYSEPAVTVERPQPHHRATEGPKDINKDRRKG